MIEVMTQAPPMASGRDHAGKLHGVRRSTMAARTMVATSRHHIGFEQIRRHAGAIADVIAHVIGDNRGIARVILGNAGFHLAHQVRAHIGAFGENSPAQPRKDRNQRPAEGKGNQRIDHGAAGGLKTHGAGQEAEIKRHAEKAEACDEQAGDGT